MNVERINFAIITSLVPLLDRVPQFKKFFKSNSNSSEDWDFFVTIAAVGYYLQSRDSTTPTNTEVVNRLVRLYPGANEALDNYRTFVNNNTDQEISDQLMAGNWVLWNLKGSAPTYEEAKLLAPILGAYLNSLVS